MEPVEDRKDAYNRGVEAQENGTWWVWIPAVADSHTLMRSRIWILVRVQVKSRIRVCIKVIPTEQQP